MLVELYASPSRLSIAALVVFGFELLFHVIAFCSTDWFTVTWNNKTTRVGLWRGCWRDGSEEKCTASLFDTEAFNTGKNSGWHNGVCILMVCSLIILVSFELVFIGYACVVRLGPYSDRLEGALVGMLIAEVIITAIVLLMAGTEVSMMKDGRLSWAYGLEVLCLILSIVITVIIYINKQLYLIKNKRNQTLDLGKDKKKSISGQYDNPVFTTNRRDSTEYSALAYTSDFQLSSNEVGTFDKESVSGSVNYVSDFTKSTSVVSYSKEPSRRSSLDSNVESTSQICRHISQSPDPTQSRHDKHTQPRNLSRKSSSSVESVV